MNLLLTINHNTRRLVLTLTGAAQNAGDGEEENATAEDGQADPTNSPYAVANKNRDDALMSLTSLVEQLLCCFIG
jgi:hypothetical protein